MGEKCELLLLLRRRLSKVVAVQYFVLHCLRPPSSSSLREDESVWHESRLTMLGAVADAQNELRLRIVKLKCRESLSPSPPSPFEATLRSMTEIEAFLHFSASKKEHQEERGGDQTVGWPV